MDEGRREQPQDKEVEKNYKIPIIKVTPNLKGKTFLSATEGSDAVMLVVSASGAVGKRFGESVQERIDTGIPVFLVSDNKADNHGILNPRKYGSTESVLDAGAMAVEKYNVNDFSLIMKTVEDLLDSGLRGKELSKAVSNKFSYQEGEEKPKEDWNTEEGVAEMRALTRQTLKRTGMSGQELDDYMKKWEFGDN